MMQPTRRTTLAGLGLTIPALATLSACGAARSPAEAARPRASPCGR